MVPSLHRAIPTPSSHKAPIANSGGAIVARSRILVSGSTATLLGTMTNETGFDVFLSGLSPCHHTRHRWRRTYPVRRLQLSSRPQPTCGDSVTHPGAMIVDRIDDRPPAPDSP